VIGFQLLERSIITIVPNGHAFASSRTEGQRKRTIDYHFKKKNSKTATPKDLEFNEILMIKNVCQGCHFRIADLHY